MNVINIVIIASKCVCITFLSETENRSCVGKKRGNQNIFADNSPVITTLSTSRTNKIDYLSFTIQADVIPRVV